MEANLQVHPAGFSGKVGIFCREGRGGVRFTCYCPFYVRGKRREMDRGWKACYKYHAGVLRQGSILLFRGEAMHASRFIIYSTGVYHTSKYVGK